MPSCFNYQIEELKKKQRDDLDKFDAQLESICAEVKKTWVSYSPPNLEAEITATVEAQRCIIAEIQSAAQETENAMAKLHEEDEGKCNKLLRYT